MNEKHDFNKMTNEEIIEARNEMQANLYQVMLTSPYQIRCTLPGRMINRDGSWEWYVRLAYTDVPIPFGALDAGLRNALLIFMANNRWFFYQDGEALSEY